MKQCKRYGIDLSWRCNWNCKTCFYHFDDRLHQQIDKSEEDIKKEIDSAVNRGCNHIVVVGQGEPTLAPTIKKTIWYCKQINITSSIITNGTADIQFYQELYVRKIHLGIP